jgi:hypothetical protein
MRDNNWSNKLGLSPFANVGARSISDITKSPELPVTKGLLVFICQCRDLNLRDFSAYKVILG